MKFGSVCSGIEAASVAWHKLGWSAAWLAEIEPFPSAVLAHQYPNVPNLGDMTLLPVKILSGEIEAPDIFCGGTPCQAFSIAGNRNSLDDARGNLSLTFCEIANAIDTVRSIPAIIFWENVPGVLSTKDNAFGCFLGELAGEDGELKPSGKKWTNAGCVFGPKRTVAWRVLDAQYFGLAQRRKRVFVVASARNDFNPAKILFEFNSLRRDTAPSRNSRETTTVDAQSGIGTYNKQRISEYSTEDIASTCAARDYKDATDLVTYENFKTVYEGKAIINTIPLNTMTILGRPSDDLKPRRGSGVGKESDPSPTLTKAHNHAVAYEHSKSVYEMHAQDARVQNVGDVFPTMSATYGSGGGNIPVTYGIQSTVIGRKPENGPKGSGYSEDISFTQTKTDVHAVAYNITFCDANGTRKDRPDGGLYVNETDVTNTLTNAGVGTNVVYTISDVAGTLDASYYKGQGSRQGGEREFVAQSFAQNQLGEVRVGDVFNTLNTNSNASGRNTPMLMTQMAVRRLTPTECERLQGFPDGYTQIPWRNKSAEDCPDGPRYKALGNSWAVPVVAWIGERIAKELLK
jgi:DNA (cytosine-5)-methyltransferase 1